jgi:enoyl-CoA hydratase
MWSYRKPIVAQVHGYCLAGGGELAGACDIIFAAEDARFGHPAGRALGIPPTLGLWPAKIGMLKTKELPKVEVGAPVTRSTASRRRGSGW